MVVICHLTLQQNNRRHDEMGQPSTLMQSNIHRNYGDAMTTLHRASTGHGVMVDIVCLSYMPLYYRSGASRPL